MHQRGTASAPSCEFEVRPGQMGEGDRCATGEVFFADAAKVIAQQCCGRCAFEASRGTHDTFDEHDALARDSMIGDAAVSHDRFLVVFALAQAGS